MNHITTIKNNNIEWLIIDKPSKKQIDWLRENFRLEEEDLQDCSPIIQRPKLNVRNGYLFMILQFPFYNRQSREVRSAEVDLFIMLDKIILVHGGELQPITDLQKICERDETFKQEIMSDGSRLLYEILNRLLHYCFPMLNHINQDLEEIENTIFDINEKRMGIIKETLRIKRNIVNFRKSMQAHKSIISKLIQNSQKIYPPSNLHQYFNHLVNHTKDIWDFLENYKDTVDALHETHESLLSHRLNEIIKTLTIISVVVFPLTLFAAIFGMNTMNAMPFVDSAYDFWFVILIMVIAAGSMLAYFKHKRWL